MLMKRKITHGDVLAASRHVLQAVSGFLIAKGLLSHEAEILFVGGLSSIITLGWMFFFPSKQIEEEK